MEIGGVEIADQDAGGTSQNLVHHGFVRLRRIK